MKTFTVQLGGEKATLTAYIADRSEKEMPNASRRPGVLIFPGGGYYMCSDREAEPVALAYMAEGYNAFVLRYSTGQGEVFPSALKEAELALQTLHENAEEWNLIEDKIAVVGFSAGGHLAACLGTTGKVRPAAMVLGYPCILDSMGEALGKKLPSAEKMVDAKTPAAFIFATCEDSVVPVDNSLLFAQALGRAKVPFELHVFQQGPHGLSLAKPLTSGGTEMSVNPRVAAWFPASVSWLKMNWGDFEVKPVQPVGEEVQADSPAMELPLRTLLESDAARQVLEEVIPEVLDMSKKNGIVLNFSLKKLAGHAPELLTSYVVKRLDQGLCQIEI